MYEIIFNNNAAEKMNPTEFQYRHVDQAYSCTVNVKNTEDRFYTMETNPHRGRRSCLIDLDEANKKYDWKTEVIKYQPGQHLEIIDDLFSYKKNSTTDRKCLLFLYTDMTKSNYELIRKHFFGSEKNFKDFSRFYESDKHFQDYFKKKLLEPNMETEGQNISIREFKEISDQYLRGNEELRLLFFKTTLRNFKLGSYIFFMQDSRYKDFPAHYLDLVEVQLLKDREKVLKENSEFGYYHIRLLNLYFQSKYYEEYKKTLKKELDHLATWTKSSSSSDFKKENEYNIISGIFSSTLSTGSENYLEKNEFNKEYILNFLSDENIDSKKYNAIIGSYIHNDFLKNFLTDKGQCDQIGRIAKVLQKNKSDLFFHHNIFYNGANLSKICGEDFLKSIQLVPRYSRSYFEKHCLNNYDEYKCMGHFQDKYWMENYSYCSTSQDCQSYKTDSFLFNSKIPKDEEQYFYKLNLHNNYEALTRTGTIPSCINNICYKKMDYCEYDSMVKGIRDYLAENVGDLKCKTENDCKIENYSNFFNGRRLDYVVYEQESHVLTRLIDNEKISLNFCKQQSPEQIKALIKSIEDNNENLKAKCENKKCKGYL